MKNCLVAQSGGPTVAINASLAGVIQGAIDSKQFDKIYGSLNGVQGLLNGRLMDLSQKFEDTPMFIELLKKSPSMYLGSCRYQLPDYSEDDAPYAYIFNKFEQYDIDAFFYIGGNDSMDTVDKLSTYAKAIDHRPPSKGNRCIHSPDTPSWLPQGPKAPAYPRRNPVPAS